MKKRKKGKKKMDLLSLMIGILMASVLIYMIIYNIRGVLPNSFWVSTTEQLAPNLVCMANNAYVGQQQIEIIVNGKTYYGCCEMCKQTLNSDSTSRFSIDPFTGEIVDKADAFIVLRSKKNDLVHYFKSKENFEKFLEKKKNQN